MAKEHSVESAHSYRDPRRYDHIWRDTVSDESEHAAGYSPGQLVRHKLFGYRGVVVDVDATFQLDDAWYEQVARSRPPKDEPWYHVLVHEAAHMTYVAQQNLMPDVTSEPIRHPMLEQFFCAFDGERYSTDRPVN
jgi:heat shock protein HspQ